MRALFGDLRSCLGSLSLVLLGAFMVMSRSANAMAPETVGSAPLSVSKSCQLLRNGKPYRAVGVNYYNAFYRTLQTPGDTSYRSGLQQLSASHIPFIRMQLLPFWPNEMKPYIDDPDRFFAAFDAFVKDAEAQNIGLVPSVFFNFRSLPDAMGEPVSAWGNPNSKTTRFARSFSQKLATRYRHSKAIWAWEFTNEMNDWANFDRAYTFYKTNPAKGTPRMYTPRDNFSEKDMVLAFRTFSDAIHVGDPDRLVSSGFNLPRHNADNLAHGKTGMDTVAEFRDVSARTNAPGQLMSFHIYPQGVRASYGIRFKDLRVTPEVFITAAAQASKAACKPMFLGEIGPDPDEKYASPAKAFDEYQRMMKAFVASDGALAALWAFDAPWNDSTNATFTNARANRLDVVIEANKTLGNP